MVSSGRALDLGDPCTPMAWQQRDLNYHQNGYQDRYGPGAGVGGSSRVGPPSTSDRISHRTDKSWRTHRDSRDSGHSGQPHLVPYSGSGQYPHAAPPTHYPPSRPSYSSGRAASRPHTPTTTTSSSSSSSSEDSEQGVVGPAPPMPHPLYGYAGYYPGYPPPMPPPGHPGYPGTLKSARSVPALALATWDGEPCPIHGGAPPGPPMYPPMHGPMHGPMSLPPPPHPGPTRRVNSIYDMRLGSPPPAAIYGTLPGRSLPADRRSLAGSAVTAGIPPHLLPPMARPLPLVLDEKGNPEPLPVRQPGDKTVSLPPDVAAKVAASVVSVEDKKEKQRVCWRGGPCVAWIILALVCLGVMLAVMLRFIL